MCGDEGLFGAHLQYNQHILGPSFVLKAKEDQCRAERGPEGKGRQVQRERAEFT